MSLKERSISIPLIVTIMKTAASTMNNNTEKRSLKDKIWNYLLENVNFITPGITTSDGEYYPGNYKRQ